jgi:hypothetical protein
VIAKGHYGKAIEVPYVFTDRIAGVSKLNQSEILNYLRQLGRIYASRLRGTPPPSASASAAASEKATP